MQPRTLFLLLTLTLLVALLVACSSEEPPPPLEEPPAAEAVAEPPPEPPLEQDFGPQGEPPLPQPEVQQEPQPVPYERAFPPPPPEPAVRIAVLNRPGQNDKGEKVAVLLGSYQQEYLQQRLGMAVKVVFISSAERGPDATSAIHYRPNFLKAAVEVASVLPAEQLVEPMTEEERRQAGIDLIVYIGAAYR